ncbi:MAG: hypothetical protein ABDH21_05995 [bacterium]
MLGKVLSRKGISLLELIVGVVILGLVFSISSTTVFYLYQHPMLDRFKHTSAYRTVFFELSKMVKEANEVKNIYNTSAVSAIYLQVRNNLYAYRIRRNVPIVQRRLEKSTDGGHSWFILSNTAGIEDIVFRATTPYQNAKVVLVSIKMNSVSKKLLTNHEFAVLLRKKHSYQAGGGSGGGGGGGGGGGSTDPITGQYIFSGMMRRLTTTSSGNWIVSYGIQLVTGSSSTSFGLPSTIYSYSISQLIHANDPFPYSNIDTFINTANNTQNIAFPILSVPDNIRPMSYTPRTMYRFTRPSNSSQVTGQVVSNIQEFFPSYGSARLSDMSPNQDPDTFELIVVGNYLYTVYAVKEIVYDPQPSTSYTRYSNSIYFAYRRNVPNYWQTNTRVSWVKRRIFSIVSTESTSTPLTTVNYNIISVRMVYGQVGTNRFHVTFILDTNNTNPNPQTRDIYYLGSPDGINWTSRSIDDQFASDNIYPLAVVPLVGNIGGNPDTLHLVYTLSNLSNPQQASIGYTSTSNTINYRTPELWNDSTSIGLRPLYRGTSSLPFYINNFIDMEAVIFNNEIHIAIGCESITVPSNPSIRANLVYMVKSNVNSGAVYNNYYNLDAVRFRSVTISLGRFVGIDFVNIFAAGLNRGLHYIRADINSIRSMDLNVQQGFVLPDFNTTYVCSLDSVYAGGYLHVSFISTPSGNVQSGTFNPGIQLSLDYIRISHPNQPYQRIAGNTISANLTANNNSVDNQALPSVYLSYALRQAIAVSNYLHILFINQSIGEVLYINPMNASLPSSMSFDTIAVHPVDRSLRINTLSFDNSVISYSCYNGSGPPSALDTRIGTLKVILANRDITEADGNRNVSTMFVNSDGSRTCGYYNDVQVVGNAIYVAYSELLSPSMLRLKMAVSRDNGQTWQTSVVNNSDSGWHIDLKVRGSIINITHSDSYGRLMVTKRVGNNWVNFQPPNQTNNVLNRAFLDNQNRLHILSFSSVYFARTVTHSNLVFSPPIAYYRVFDNNTNTFLTNTGLVGDDLMSVPIHSQMFSSIGTYGDIFVQPDGTVLILTNATPAGETYASVYLLVRDSSGVWRQPIPINFGIGSSTSFLRYETLHLRINRF